MKLVIVESPNKTKKIQQYAGSGYKVAASMGHIRDLPEKEMGVEPPEYRPKYQVTKPDVVKKLKALAKDSDEVILAMDLDREGEAIAWHLYKALGLKKASRVTFAEITKDAVTKALKNPGQIDIKMVAAQEARRVLDRLVGYKVSFPISKIVGQKASAGRVQSLALRMVAEREIEIANFKPTKHFGVTAHFDTNGSHWKASWKPILPKGQQYFTDKDFAQKVVDSVKTLHVDKVDQKESRKKAPPPFTTSTLQQAASVRYKMGAKKTMDAAQKLFEAGLITYHRTDNPNLSDEAISKVRQYLTDKGYSEYLPKNPNTWKAKKDAQEAHEAIRPTDIENKSPDVNNETEKKIYDLIWKRTVVSQMSDVIFDVTTVDMSSVEKIDDKPQYFQAIGRVVKFSGWQKFGKDEADESEKEEAQTLPKIDQGVRLTPEELSLEEKMTKPPPRYTEASLIKKLEKEGIGRPSTYASIINTIFQRQYVQDQKNKLFATELGLAVHKALQGRFAFYEIPYTRSMEEHLDQIASGKNNFKDVISSLDTEIGKDLQKLDDLPKEEMKPVQSETIGKCPVCGSAVYENTKAFGCSAWKTDGCKFAIWKNCLSKLGKSSITKSQAKSLLKREKVDMKNLKSKKGNKFSAKAELQEDPKYGWQVKLVFDK